MITLIQGRLCKNNGPISMKLGRMVKYKVRMKLIKFGQDPQPDTGYPVSDYQIPET